MFRLFSKFPNSFISWHMFGGNILVKGCGLRLLLRVRERRFVNQGAGGEKDVWSSNHCHSFHNLESSMTMVRLVFCEIWVVRRLKPSATAGCQRSRQGLFPQNTKSTYLSWMALGMYLTAILLYSDTTPTNLYLNSTRRG